MQHTLAYAGIDPDPNKINGAEGRDAETVIYDYLTSYIDQVAPHICAFKAQKAFFDLHAGGHDLLKSTIRYVHQKYPHLPVMLDCKIGDIGNTMSCYIKNIFHHLDCDGVLLNPYMGDDVFEEMSQYPDKIIGVLAKTSNPGGALIQDQILQDGSPLWMHVLSLAMTRWNKAQNIMPVLSAVDDASLLIKARQMIPQDTPILFAGVGAQGRDENAARHLFNEKKSGTFVSSSRPLMYPKTLESQSLAAAQAQAAMDLKNTLQTLRNR